MVLLINRISNSKEERSKLDELQSKAAGATVTDFGPREDLQLVTYEGHLVPYHFGISFLSLSENQQKFICPWQFPGVTGGLSLEVWEWCKNLIQNGSEG